MKRIQSVEDWRQLLARSDEQPFLLFKYSTTCFASLTAKKEMQRLTTELPIYLVVVQTERELSNVIAEDLSVRHESPQLLILKDGKGTWQATHYHIKAPKIEEALESYA